MQRHAVVGFDSLGIAKQSPRIVRAAHALAPEVARLAQPRTHRFDREVARIERSA